MLRYEIPLKLPSLNEYVNACRSNFYAGNNMKKKYQKMIKEYVQYDGKPLENDISITLIWHEKTRRRDYDNIVFAKKFLFDALQEQGVMKNDKQIFEVLERVVYDNTYEIEMTIEEV